MTSDANDRRRVFVITVGRTGSSLLAAILADAGADFGLAAAPDWDPVAGAYEHPRLDAIVDDFERMAALGQRRPAPLVARARWTAARHRAKARLRALLPHAVYFKGELDPLVHWAARFGYPPTVIVSYRTFGEVARSLGHLHPQSPGYHAAKYDRVLRNGLALAGTYGGCTVDFGELTDAGETAWAAAVGAATGLETEALLVARAARVKAAAAAPQPAPEPFPSCRDTYQQLRSWRGIHLVPSEPAVRALQRRAAE